MLFQCWPTVFDVGPTLKQHWVDVSLGHGDPFNPLTANHKILIIFFKYFFQRIK